MAQGQESVTQILGKLQGSWDASQAAYDTMFGGLKVPASEYNAKLSHCNLKISGNGNPMINREFTILDGEHVGAKVFDRIMLGTEMGPVFTRRFIDQCGYNQPKATKDLEKLISDIDKEGLEFQIKVVHNGDFVNVTILKPLSEVAAGEGEAEAAPTDDESAGGEAAPAQDDAAEADRVAAIAYGRGQGVPVEDEDDLATVVEKMSQYEYEEKLMTAEEVELLERVGLSDSILRKPAPAAAKAAAKPAAAAAKPAAASKAAPAGKKGTPPAGKKR